MDYPQQNSTNNLLPDKVPLINPEDASVFQKFLERDLSQNSKKAITSDLKHFLQWYVVTNQEQFQFARLTERDIIAYKNWCKERQKPRTINRRLVNLRSLCKFAIREGKLKTNVAENIKQLALQPLAPKSLTLSELRKLLREVELRGNLRDRLIVEIMVGAGLRVSELTNLMVQDIEISERKGHLIIRNGKGNKTRLVPLNQTIRKLMQEYLEKEKPAHRVFIGQRGALTTIAFNKIIEKYAEKADIKCHPHQLRHTFSYRYLEYHPGEIVGLAQLLGHSSLNTTALYTGHTLEILQEKVEDLVF